jgi:hypothetical protein
LIPVEIENINCERVSWDNAGAGRDCVSDSTVGAGVLAGCRFGVGLDEWPCPIAFCDLVKKVRMSVPECASFCETVAEFDEDV